MTAQPGVPSGPSGNPIELPCGETIASDDSELSFPRQYGTIRRCISDLATLEGTFYATIEGRDVETGDSWVVQGRVDEVAFGPTQEVATLVVVTDEGLVDVGGQVAAYEDIEAHEILVDRGSPPGV